ncbi:MAG: DUF935 family protein [Oceanococcaceae bacterium]
MTSKVRQLAGATPPPTSIASGSLFQDSVSAGEALIDLLTNIPDPDLILERAGMRRCDLRKLETDDEIYAALETRRDAAISTPWRLEPTPDTPQAPVDWLWQELQGHVDTALRDIWQAVPFGYSVVESVYRRMDQGRIGLAHVGAKPIEWFRPTPDGRLVANYGDASQALDTDFKFLLTRRNATFRNPYGEALLSRLYWPWFFRHNGWRFWMQFVERFADPLLLGKANNPKELAAALTSIGSQAHVAVGTDEEVVAVTTGLAGEFDRLEIALIKRVQKVILGQTLTSDIPSGGSLAAAKVHNEVRDDRRNSDLRLMAGTMQRLVNAIWALNRFAGTPPDFILADGQGLEPERTERDARLVQSGVLKFTPKYLLRVYDFEEGDFELAPAGSTRPAGTSLQAAAGDPKFTPRQQELESLADASAGDAADPIPAQTIRAAVRAAQSPEDLADRLGTLLAESSPTALQSALDRALYAADVLGYLQEREGKPVAELDQRKATAEAERAEAELEISRQVLAGLREARDA